MTVVYWSSLCIRSVMMLISASKQTIKKLQQRLTDLKKTLQRELNVQTLPNDDVTDHLTTGHDHSRPNQQYSSASSKQQTLTSAAAAAALHVTNGYNSGTAGSSGDERSPSSFPVTSRAHAALHKHSLYANATSNISASDLADFAGTFKNNPSASSKDSGHKSSAVAAVAATRSSRTGALDYERDINFNYLRHVVLKFMLSRESEALHLIKAVAMLLDFTSDEQKMLRETLEYKMSWFGSRPKLGEGQFSKYVPPTY